MKRASAGVIKQAKNNNATFQDSRDVVSRNDKPRHAIFVRKLREQFAEQFHFHPVIYS